MEKIDWQNRFLAFKGDKLIADGKQLEVALKLKAEGAEPALRRGGNHRQIAHAFERQRQGAWYGCGGEGQHIDLGP